MAAPAGTILRRLLTAALLLWSVPAAAQLLKEVVQHGSADADAGEAPEVEILLGLPVRLREAFTSNDGRSYRARLAATGEADDPWQFAELRFDEPGYDVTRVSVEGSAGRGYTLVVRFHSRVAVATIPQYVSDRVSLKYLDDDDHRRAAARSARNPGPEQRWAVEIDPHEALLHLEQIPRRLVLNRVLYLPPAETAPVARLGFFSRDKARSVLSDVRGEFPDARIVAVNEHEAAYGERMRLNGSRLSASYAGSSTSGDMDRHQAPAISIATATHGSVPDGLPEPTGELARWDEAPDDSLLRQAKAAYIEGNYPRAIALYTQAAELAPFRLEALEMLGVTREQTGQLAQAKLAYETALAEYPDHGAAHRIRARLQALVSINEQPRELRPAERTATVSWQTTAHLTQFYRRYQLDIDGRQSTVPIDALFSDADVTVRRNGAAFSHEGRASFGHLQDFSDGPADHPFRVQSLYWQTRFEPLRTRARIGRQSQRRSGVLGRFDGVAVTAAATPDLDVQALGGYLVDSSHDSPGSERPFWGVNAELRLLDDDLSLTPFFVQQQADGVVDRQAAGLQAELYTDAGSYFGMVDYDLHHRVLNHALASANVRFGEATRVFGSVDHRRSPYLTTRNALIGQPVQDLSELELLLVEERLEDIAADRSAVTTMARFGIDQRLAGSWAISVDTALMDFGSTDSSASVAGLEAHQDFSASAQIRSDDAFGRGNFGAVQVRYYRSRGSRTLSTYFNNRLGLWGDWWLYPRLSVDHRQYDDGDQSQLRIKPSLRFDYRYSRRFRLELEAGYEWTARDMPAGDVDMRGLFVVAGYRLLL